MKSAYALLALFALLLVGCSGNGGETEGRGEVAGIVFDEDGVPVRDAHVYFDGAGNDDKDAQTNVNGVYVLIDMPAGDQNIRVESTRDGTRYFGSNIAHIENGQRTMNHNIAVYPDDRLASIEGFVQDRQGNRLQNALVFVKQRATNTVLSSAYGITNSEGRYLVGSLRSNMEYDVQVNGEGYNSDFDSFILTNREVRTLNFTLPDAEDVVLNPPANLVATAWTSPRTRAAGFNDVAENIKHLIKPDYKPRATQRGTAGGNFIEVDLTWDPIVDQALLGYGIYRSDQGSTLRDIYFLQDPLAELFADMSDSLREDRNYTYRVTTLSTIVAESEFSDAASAVPLGDLVLRNITASSRPTFRWDPASGADSYVIYLFDRYPSIGVTDIWNNEENPTTSTSFEYTGGALASGRYFYVVVGVSDEGSFSLSQVGEFNVP
ncbi:MAG: carboxypeptidase regulatory-like domain-containing protein [Fimbriimonas sp.]